MLHSNVPYIARQQRRGRDDVLPLGIFACKKQMTVSENIRDCPRVWKCCSASVRPDTSKDATTFPSTSQACFDVVSGLGGSGQSSQLVLFCRAPPGSVSFSFSARMALQSDQDRKLRVV